MHNHMNIYMYIYIFPIGYYPNGPAFYRLPGKTDWDCSCRITKYMIWKPECPLWRRYPSSPSQTWVHEWQECRCGPPDLS